MAEGFRELRKPTNGAPVFHKTRIPLEIPAFLIAALDAAMIYLAGRYALEACAGCPPHLPQHYLSAIASCGMFVLGLFYFRGLYRLPAIISPFRSVRRIVLCCFFGFTLAAMIAVTQNFYQSFLPAWVVWFLILTMTAIVGGRIASFSALYFLGHYGVLQRRIAIVGAGAQAQRLMEQLSRGTLRVNSIVGLFDDRRRERENDVANLPIDGDIDALIARVRHNSVDDIIVALPWNADQRLIEIIGRLRHLPVRIHVGSDLIGFHFPGQINTDFCRGLPMLEVVKKPLAGWRSIIKAVEDRTLALLILTVAAPLMVVIAIAIRLETPGPAIFRQIRYGFNNQQFRVFKFRSMNVSPDDEIIQQATRDDPRITRLGRMLRRTSLDELPQLINVLMGQMSLVGPRPHAVDHNEHYGRIIDGYFARHKVKPGITGWAQVNGLRGETDTLEKMQYRVRYDLYYIENWSLMFDLEILMLTVFVVFTGRNAH